MQHPGTFSSSKSWKRSAGRATAAVCAWSLSLAAHGSWTGTSGPTGQERWEAGLDAGVSSISYAFPRRRGALTTGWGRDGDRLIVSLHAARGLTDSLDLYAAGGYLYTQGLWLSDGSGFLAAAGARWTSRPLDGTSLQFFLQASHLSEEYQEKEWYSYERTIVTEEPLDVETETLRTIARQAPEDGGPYRMLSLGASSRLTEIALGGLLRHTLGRTTLFGGFEVIPFSEGRLKIDPPGGKGGMERSGALTVRAGASVDLLEKIAVRGEAALGSEQAFRLGISRSF